MPRSNIDTSKKLEEEANEGFSGFLGHQVEKKRMG